MSQENKLRRDENKVLIRSEYLTRLPVKSKKIDLFEIFKFDKFVVLNKELLNHLKQVFVVNLLPTKNRRNKGVQDQFIVLVSFLKKL